MTKTAWLLRVALVVFICTGLDWIIPDDKHDGNERHPPRVAVLVEKGFPTLGGTPSLPSFKMIEVLAQHGIQSQALFSGGTLGFNKISTHNVLPCSSCRMGTPSQQWLSITLRQNFTRQADVWS